MTSNKQYFITGTDTEVGKTLVTAALVRAFQQRHYSAIGFKPIAAGAEKDANNQWQNEDAMMLDAVNSTDRSGRKLTLTEINPFCFAPAIAPHIAAKLIAAPLNLQLIKPHLDRMSQTNVDIQLFEGAGGWRVPLNDNECFSDLAIYLNSPVVLVVGMKLGCLNHALLTAEAIQRDGLPIVGWVANHIQNNCDYLEENRQTLKNRFDFPCLGEIPYLTDANAESAASALNIDLLCK